jgi:hypothetical protein
MRLLPLASSERSREQEKLINATVLIGSAMLCIVLAIYIYIHVFRKCRCNIMQFFVNTFRNYARRSLHRIITSTCARTFSYAYRTSRGDRTSRSRRRTSGHRRAVRSMKTLIRSRNQVCPSLFTPPDFENKNYLQYHSAIIATDMDPCT